MFKVLLSIVGVLLIIGGIFGFRIYKLSKITTGEKIVENSRPKSALLVLDIQNDTLGIKEYGNTDSLMNNINSAITYAENNHIDILYLTQGFSNPIDKLLSGGLYKKGSVGAELSSQLRVLSPHIFSKEKTDAFSSNELEEYLLKEGITTLYLIGADASACVYKTALGGRNRGYEVIVLSDAVFSINDTFLDRALANYKKNKIKTRVLSEFMN
ncbi:cysteine hydrolase [Jeotgalibaca ciconiae]|uniref:Cysteine hydrolase n=1 Tax=Jeotgalibaca ciconiae TaxID=2496265 RepID=A0A3Q9BJA8_9LACT|nr:cysteine hydrolase [Jeotgalibaca ciconiae]AZP03667.1 cysteine hydrolase [Jeotgalibaca ciconiae]